MFQLWKVFQSMMNIVSLEIFLANMEANNMDILYYHNGLLGYEELRLGAGSAQEQATHTPPELKQGTK